MQTYYRPKNSSGFSLLELLIVVTVIGILLALAVPNLRTARRTANEASAIASVKSIIGAEALYFSSYGYQSTYGTFNDLVNHNCIDSALMTEGRNYYTFQVTTPTPITYNITASPGATLAGEMRYFFADETGIIREALGVPATVTSPPINR